MFINSKISMSVTLADGSVHKIPRGFIGEIPGELAGHWMIRKAIESGDIATPTGKTDAHLEAADAEAKALKEIADETPKAKAKKK